MEYLKKYEAWSDLNPKNWKIVKRKRISDLISNLKIDGVKSIKPIISQDKDKLKYIIDVDFSHLKDDVSPKLLSFIDKVFISVSIDVSTRDCFLKRYISFNINIFKKFNLPKDYVGFRNTYFYLNGGAHKTWFDGESYSEFNILHGCDDDNLGQISDYIRDSVSGIQYHLDITKSGIVALQAKQVEIEKSSKKRMSDVEILKSKADDIEDYLTELYDISIDESREVKDGRIIFNFKIDGIKVIPESHTSYRAHDSHTFDVAQMVMSDELVNVMRAITSVKKRVDSIIPGIIIRIYFKDNSLKMEFVLPASGLPG